MLGLGKKFGFVTFPGCRITFTANRRLGHNSALFFPACQFRLCSDSGTGTYNVAFCAVKLLAYYKRMVFQATLLYICVVNSFSRTMNLTLGLLDLGLCLRGFQTFLSLTLLGMFAHLMNVNHLLDGSHSRRFFIFFRQSAKLLLFDNPAVMPRDRRGDGGRTLKERIIHGVGGTLRGRNTLIIPLTILSSNH
jgi:hypothetical protein